MARYPGVVSTTLALLALALIPITATRAHAEEVTAPLVEPAAAAEAAPAKEPNAELELLKAEVA